MDVSHAAQLSSVSQTNTFLSTDSALKLSYGTSIMSMLNELFKCTSQAANRMSCVSRWWSPDAYRIWFRRYGCWGNAWMHSIQLFLRNDSETFFNHTYRKLVRFIISDVRSNVTVKRWFSLWWWTKIVSHHYFCKNWIASSGTISLKISFWSPLQISMLPALITWSAVVQKTHYSEWHFFFCSCNQ